ncbi:hypothetical protein B0H14DRAFT_3124110 [Mycena olivaceomarginata]|nr:hypothetical protein B0H14DRAFT_3124110 [Mycena olivaceomarginata]
MRAPDARGSSMMGPSVPPSPTLTVDARSLPAVDTARSRIALPCAWPPSPLLPPPSASQCLPPSPWLHAPPSPSASLHLPPSLPFDLAPPPELHTSAAHPDAWDGSGKAGGDAGDVLAGIDAPRVGAACDATAQVAADRRGHGRRRERDARDGELLLPGVTSVVLASRS